MKRGRPTAAESTLRWRLMRHKEDIAKRKATRLIGQPARILDKAMRNGKRISIAMAPADNPLLALYDGDKAAFMLWVNTHMQSTEVPQELLALYADISHADAVERGIKLEMALLDLHRHSADLKTQLASRAGRRPRPGKRG